MSRRRMGRGARIAVGITAGVVGLVIVGAGVLAFLNRPLSATEVDAAIAERLEAVVAEEPGVSSALFATASGQTGQIRQYAAGTTGVGSGVDAGVDSPFLSASVGKMMLASVYGQLIDEGVVSFDDPVSRWLDDETLAGLFVVDGVDHAGDVTIGQLLEHTSGAADYFAGPVTAGPTFREVMADDPDRLFTPHDLLDFSREHQQPVGTPGERFAYSDTGFVLLGLALEAITGASYAEVLDARLFEPLGMADSYLLTEYGVDNGILAVDVDGTDVSTRNILSVDWAGGGVVTTLADLVTFLRAFEGGDLVSDDVHARMTDAHHQSEAGIHYGAGVADVRFSELSPLLFDMSDARGGLGATGTYALYDPTQDEYYVANLGSLDAAERAIEELIEIRLLLNRQVG